MIAALPFLFAVLILYTRRSQHSRHSSKSPTTEHIPVVLSSPVTFNGQEVAETDPLDEEWMEEEQELDPDYGGLYIRYLSEDGAARALYRYPHDFLTPDTENINEKVKWHHGQVDYYYAFDDDAERNPYNAWDDPSLALEKTCRRTNWHRLLFVNCNTMHEFDFLSKVIKGQTKYLGEGAYRQVHGIDFNSNTPVAFKEFEWESAYDYKDFEFMRMDAIVSERLSSDPKTVDVYAYCGLGMLSEGLPMGDLETVALPIHDSRSVYIELEDEDDVDVLNSLSLAEKLNYSLQMAEALAELHGFPDGVIVHDDVHLGQFLLASSGKLKMHDFNRAEIMLWNEEDQEYCRYKNYKGAGDVSFHLFSFGSTVPQPTTVDLTLISNAFFSFSSGDPQKNTLTNP